MNKAGNRRDRKMVREALNEIQESWQYQKLMKMKPIEPIEVQIQKKLIEKTWIGKLDNSELYLLKLRSGFKNNDIVYRLLDNDSYIQKRYGKNSRKRAIRSLQTRISDHKKIFARIHNSIGEFRRQQEVVYENGNTNAYIKSLSLIRLMERRIQKRTDFEKDSGSPVPVDMLKDMKMYLKILKFGDTLEYKLGIGAYSPSFKEGLIKNKTKKMTKSTTDVLGDMIITEAVKVGITLDGLNPSSFDDD